MPESHFPSSHAWEHQDFQVIMPVGRTERDFEEEHHPSPYAYKFPSNRSPRGVRQSLFCNSTGRAALLMPSLDGDDNEQTQDRGISQIVPSPWYYPEKHQEIVEDRPSAWLGRRDDAAFTQSPAPKRRTSDTTAVFMRSRSRPEPIRIEGYSRSVKDSPFFRFGG